uniref:Uncharacterized protein n=1 Tax=Tanacetum cinerariifolium TaxID=118510 RepID=A0A699HSL3_TANCI|nr:hypothetical protein [Tanacetum cinerariifolium]
MDFFDLWKLGSPLDIVVEWLMSNKQNEGSIYNIRTCYDVNLVWLRRNNADVGFLFVGLKWLRQKLKYVAKGEPRHTPTFGMLFPEAMMSKEIKESQPYVYYVIKYPHAQSSSSTRRHGMGKSLVRRSHVLIPKKKKDVVPRRPRTITFADNVLQDLDEALEYAKMSDTDSNDADDQTTEFMIKPHDKEPKQPLKEL